LSATGKATPEFFMIVTLTLNPSLDLTVRLKQIDYKDINRVREIQKDPGGKGINISRIISRLGGKTRIFGFLGGYTGKKIKELLDQEGVANNFIRISGENRSNITIDLPEESRQIKINEDGPRITGNEIEPLMDKLSDLSSRDFLIMSGSIPPGLPANLYAKIIGIMHRRGVKVALDADGEALYQGLKAGPYLIKPNVYEAQRLLYRLTGRKIIISSEDSFIDAAATLGKCGAEIVIISWGPKGIVVVRKDKFWRSYPPLNLKYTGVGAGDAVVAGFVYALSKNNSIEECIRWGIACGTASALQKGTRLCRAVDVRNLLRKVVVQQVC